jgi:hypothetical protein
VAGIALLRTTGHVLAKPASQISSKHKLETNKLSAEWKSEMRFQYCYQLGSAFVHVSLMEDMIIDAMTICDGIKVANVFGSDAPKWKWLIDTLISPNTSLKVWHDPRVDVCAIKPSMRRPIASAGEASARRTGVARHPRIRQYEISQHTDVR